jgi:hypothetical protein
MNRCGGIVPRGDAVIFLVRRARAARLASNLDYDPE